MDLSILLDNLDSGYKTINLTDLEDMNDKLYNFVIQNMEETIVEFAMDNGEDDLIEDSDINDAVEGSRNIIHIFQWRDNFYLNCTFNINFPPSGSIIKGRCYCKFNSYGDIQEINKEEINKIIMHYGLAK